MLYTKTEAADQLKVSTSTVERMVHRGDLAVTKLGTCAPLLTGFHCPVCAAVNEVPKRQKS